MIIKLFKANTSGISEYNQTGKRNKYNVALSKEANLFILNLSSILKMIKDVNTVDKEERTAIFHGVDPNETSMFKRLASKEYRGYPGGCGILHDLATNANSALSPPKT